MTPCWFNLDNLPKLASNVTDLFVVSNVQLGYLKHFQFLWVINEQAVLQSRLWEKKKWKNTILRRPQKLQRTPLGRAKQSFEVGKLKASTFVWQ